VITRDHFALNYSAGNPADPPPLCYGTSPGAAVLPTKGRIFRGGAVALQMNGPRMMADLTDRGTWQRAYRFT
jgi:hypothetical protein